MSSFVGLFTGLSGLRAAQTGIDVTSHNVANANTPGYTRQRVELAARPTYEAAVGRIGTGVDVQRIARLRDTFLDDRFRAAVADHAENGVRAEFLTSLEFLSGEPDLGLTSRINRLWTAAESWANNPADSATRRQVLTELASISDGFNATAFAWDQLAADTGERRDTLVGEVNRLLGNLHELNTTIANAIPGRIGPDVYDQRDLLLDRLSQLTGATVRLEADQSVTARLGGTTLLAFGQSPAVFDVDPVLASIRVVPAGAVTAQPITAGGELGGLQRVLTTDLPEWRTRLDVLAAGLADAVNSVNTVGPPPLLQPLGDPLLEFGGADGTQSAAATLRLISQDVQRLVASTNGLAAPPHDGSNARRLADLRTDTVAFTGTVQPRTVEAQLADLVVGLAGAVRSTRNSSDAAQGVATGARLARAAEHGVSLDEEMVSLVRYQRALEAAARVMTTVDQALETLVNRVGIVGR